MQGKLTRYLLAVLVMAGLLAGCGPEKRYWCHPTKPALAAWQGDNYQCEGEAYQRASARGDAGSKRAIKEEWIKCMRARGWVLCPKRDDD